MDENRIAELIDNKVSVALRLHSKDIIEQTEIRTRNIIDSKFIETSKKLNNEVEQIFKEMLFINKLEEKLKRYIDSTLKFNLTESNLHFVVRKIVEDITKSIFKDIIEDVVKNVVKNINKKLNNDYKIAKELSYSIDAEIKHVMADAPISAVSEEEIKARIKIVMKQTSNAFIKKMLNDKGSKQIELK